MARRRVIVTEKAKEFTLVFIAVLLGTVLAERLKDTAIPGIVIVAGGLFGIPLLIISCVKYLGKKGWGDAALSAALAGLWARAVWMDLSHCPWHQLLEEIDKVVNVLMKNFK
jgi:hypothetical protein